MPRSGPTPGISIQFSGETPLMVSIVHYEIRPARRSRDLSQEGSFLGRSRSLGEIGRVSDSAARARLDRWKSSLLDPNERLLDLNEAGIPIAVDPVRLAFQLAAGGAFSLSETALAPDELSVRLRELRRAAHAAL